MCNTPVEVQFTSAGCLNYPGRTPAAAHFLGLANYEAYCPRIREMRSTHGRRYAATPSLFPNYLFVRVEVGWWNARWCCGVAALIMNGSEPANVADAIVDEIRSRERGGLFVLPEPPSLRPGDSVHIVRGAFAGLSGLVAGMRGHERVAVLLAALGRVTLPAGDVFRPSCRTDT
jgi:transcription antitermination factor NusG